jgi:flagellum-specific ATP synthase
VSLLDLDALSASLDRADQVTTTGRVTRVSGLIVEATLPSASVGTACCIAAEDGEVAAEVVGFSNSAVLLMPVGETRGIREGAPVTPTSRTARIPVGPALLGRVVDPMMVPIDGLGALPLGGTTAVRRAAPPAMTRRRISSPLPTRVRAIDSCLTLGEGQRIGIFAGAGVGKSSLLGMLARSACADVIVVALIGERGREVREFVERDLGAEGLARSVVVVATGDQAPLMRVRAAESATAVAEHFRAKGQKVLLMMDSLTRVAMALREIGLAASEPPTSKGYPPSVFAELPRLLERAGNDDGEGSITGIYTVLVEGDDLSDPVADSARAALDGHVVLSRKLAESGHFPAIDVLASVSRVMTDIAATGHQRLAGEVRDVLAAYAEAADLVDIGAYVHGSNPRVDRALAVMGEMRAFLRQGRSEASELPQTLARLSQLFAAQGAAVAPGRNPPQGAHAAPTAAKEGLA